MWKTSYNKLMIIPNLKPTKNIYNNINTYAALRSWNSMKALWNAKLKPRLHFSIEVQYCCIFSGFQIQTIVMTQSWQHPGIIKSMNRALKGEQACTQCNRFKTSFFPIELLSTMGEKREANIGSQHSCTGHFINYKLISSMYKYLVFH